MYNIIIDLFKSLFLKEADAGTIIKYLVGFKNTLEAHLADGVEIYSQGYIPCSNVGAVIVFDFLKKSNEDKSALGDIPEIRKDLRSLSEIAKDFEYTIKSCFTKDTKFLGTNIYLKDNRIVIIKEDNSIELWNKSAISRDVGKILMCCREE